MAAPRGQARAVTAAGPPAAALAISAAPGTYVLLLELAEPVRLAIGGRRRFELEAGLHAYVGSALGPGGLRARLRRHVASSSRRHWHLDHLAPFARIHGALVREDRLRLECAWARWVGSQSRSCVRGFGASDCACPGHLFLLGEVAQGTAFVDAAVEALAARHLPREQLLAIAGR
jgi:Uri superfamily endonuclease